MTRDLSPGMGEAVARRTVFRKMNDDGTYQNAEQVIANKTFRWETWGEVANRVSEGSMTTLLKRNVSTILEERLALQDAIASGQLLMSGRHLQHGDADQHTRNIEVFSNCSTAMTSYLQFYLLLNGSGVGRCYDDDLMVIDWSKQPFIHVALNETHPDYDHTNMESLAQIKHKYSRYGITIFTVQDSREGWAKALEHLESLIFEGGHENDIIIYDFSLVRPRGSLIKGMQLRMSSGPVPTMNMFNNIKSLKGCKNPLWWQTMYVDHYAAESVLVGGARRSARIAVKHWRDPDIIDFINLKQSWTIPDTLDSQGQVIRKGRKAVPLWSANNSVGVDGEFWKQDCEWSKKVFYESCYAAYHHGTGEPGFINLHKLMSNRDKMFLQTFGSKRYPSQHGHHLLKRLMQITMTKQWVTIINPCSEIALSLFGGYCVIGDCVPYHSDTIEQAERTVRLTARALIRTNLLDNVYSTETRRTNRIGVGLTGIHEFMWKFFRLGFKESLTVSERALSFWNTIAKLSRAVVDECKSYSKLLGVNVPETCLTIKPSGTISKLFGLTEGAHLPSMREYLRWVQFRSDDPLIQKYQKLGYKVKYLKQYEGTAVIGFPTQPTICTLNMGDKLITAPEATMQEQFTWLRLLEYYWINSGDEGSTTGNQVSYTLKYDKKKVDFTQYRNIIMENMPGIRCCAVMPTSDTMDDAEYEYLPEEPVSLEMYNEYVNSLQQELAEDIDLVHISCPGGACPVEINK